MDAAPAWTLTLCHSRARDDALRIGHTQKESPKTNDLDKDELEEDDDEKGREVVVVLHVLSDLDLLLEVVAM